jgi:hypothetical protein
VNGVPWTPSEDLLLRRLASQKVPRLEIARIIERTPSSIQSRAKKLGVSLDPRKWERPVRDPDVTTWTEADRLAAWADVPQELAELVVEMAHAHNLEVRAVRSERRDEDLVWCRWDIARRAKELGFTLQPIGRALNRDHTTVLYGLAQTIHNRPTGTQTGGRIAA